MEVSIGIDLGASNCCVAVSYDGKVDVVPDELGQRTFPSWVSFTSEDIQVGQIAKDRATVDPCNSICHVLQLIGKKRSEILHLLEKLPYCVTESEDGRLKINVSAYDRQQCSFVPEEIVAIILSKIKLSVEKHLNCNTLNVATVIISSPICFKLPQLQALKTAAKIAGLGHCMFSSSSVLAAIAFKQQNPLNIKTIKPLIVFDMGSCYVEAIVVTRNEAGKHQVQCAASSSECGGDFLTNSLVSYVIHELQSKRNITIPSDKKTQLLLWNECDEIKKRLSSCSVAYLQISSVITSLDSGSLMITRKLFEELCEDQFSSALEVVSQVCEDIDKEQMKDIILVGASTRIPRIQELLMETYLYMPNKSLNLDEAVAIGAALKAYSQLPKPTELPSFVSHDVLIQEVVHHSIGIETEEGTITKIIHKNEVFPITRGTIFASSDHFHPVVINLFEGDNMDIRGNTFLGEFSIEKDCAGQNIRIDLSLDESYTLSFKAKDGETDVMLSQVSNSCLQPYTTDVIELMAVRNKSIKERNLQITQCREAKNILEEYVIELKSSVTYDNVINECDKVLELLEESTTNSLTLEKLVSLHLQLKHFYETQVTASKYEVLPKVENEVSRACNQNFYNVLVCR